MTLPTTLEVFDDDGILALVDVAAYRSSVSWSDLEEHLVPHFAAEAAAGHCAVWRTSELGGGTFVVDVVPAPTSAASTRELTASIEVTAGRLHLVNYTDLTMAADEEGPVLPYRLGADWYVEVENGRYALTVRQLFDPAEDVQAAEGPSFEIVLAPGGQAGDTPVGVHWLR